MYNFYFHLQLSKECRSEMQYYRLLAKEVEKRISILQPYVESDTDSNEDKTDAPEISECVRDNTVNDVVQLDPSHKFVDCIKDIPQEETRAYSPLHRGYNCSVTDSSHPPSHLILDFSLNINENINEINNSFPEPIEIPERDYNCMKSGDMLQDVAMKNMKCKQNTIVEEIVNFSFSIGRDPSIDSTLQDSSNHTGPSSLTTKSFTGSLNNIHTQNDENNHNPLVRQHSYTILNPSPQLLAHLEVQSLNLGVDMSCISMSESLTNLSCPGKKRRSWDLETAKVKWSNMALELKQKNLSRPNPKKNSSKGPPLRNLSPTRAKCVAAARTKYSSLSLKSTVRTEGLQRPQTTSPPKTKSPLHTRTSSPVRETPSNSTIILEEPLSMRTKTINSVKEIKNGNTKIVPKGEVSNPESHKKEPLKTPNHKNPHQKNVSPYQQKNLELVKSSVKKQGNDTSKPVTSKQLLVSEAHDPAAKVRELYEKIQKQHYLQMASLVEKQKREQMLLQQAFEEQNNLLFKQLKTICPTSPDKIKEAWAEKTDKPDRGPVSLSQLISPKVPDNLDSPLSSTLTDTNKCINFCNEVLKKSKDISSTIKSNGKPHSQIDAKNQPMIESRTRTNSPVGRNTPTSRKLNYDTSASSDRDYDLMLTDRTNDTLADLNVTFPSDSEECRPANHSPLCAAELTVIHRTTPIRSTDSAISYMEQTIQKSMNSCSARPGSVINNCQLPTPKQVSFLLFHSSVKCSIFSNKLRKTIPVKK